MERSEALKRVADTIGHMPFSKDVVEAFETLIPELEGFRDESIYKALSRHFSEDKRVEVFSGISPKEVVEYLERAHDALNREMPPRKLAEFKKTLANTLYVDGEFTEDQARAFADTYGDGLYKVARGEMESGLDEDEAASADVTDAERPTLEIKEGFWYACVKDLTVVDGRSISRGDIVSGGSWLREIDAKTAAEHFAPVFFPYDNPANFADSIRRGL